MFNQCKNQMREGLLVAALLMVLTSISTEAIANSPDPTVDWVVRQTFGTTSHDSEYLCGQPSSLYVVGKVVPCDMVFDYISGGICTLLKTTIFLSSALIEKHADEADGYYDCTGGIIRMKDGRHAILWNRDSSEELHSDFKRIYGRDSRLLAVFDTRETRCGAVVKGLSGVRFSGVGSTASRSEYDAMQMCRAKEGAECRVTLSGRCNAWRRTLDK